jgi:hypothetical protein
MTFYLNQKLECIKDGWIVDEGPQLGEIVTTEFLNYDNPWAPNLYLGLVGFRHNYLSTHFRPIVEPRTELPESITKWLDVENHPPVKEPVMAPFV